tara:strand:+ start:1193 stop:2131 length:939 start_codon:yes stop_codon:yes gene_type:complete
MFSRKTIREMVLKELNSMDLEEGKICDKGIAYVTRTDPGGKDIKKGKDGKLKNWSARAAQIASKKCKDPSYGTGKSKKKNEEIGEPPDIEKHLDECWSTHERVPGTKKGAPGSCRPKGSGKKKNEAVVNEDGGLKAWEKENWTHSDGSPCGGGKGDGSSKRCKPASKWKTMSKSEKAADNAKKKKANKAGKYSVSATKKGKVTKSHTKRKDESLHESLHDFVVQEMMAALEEGGKCTGPTKKASSTAKGKKWMKCTKQPGGGYKRVHWGQKGVRVTGKSGNTKRKKSFKARHNCSNAKAGSAQAAACKDWAE